MTGLPDCFDCKYGGLGHPCRCADGSYDFAKAGRALVLRGRQFSGASDAPTPPDDDETDWITDCEYELIEDHPALIVPLIVAAMAACESPQDAAFVAAGLVENALVKHGPAVIGDLERLASRHAKVRFILSGVWSQGGSVHQDVWKRLALAIGSGPRMSDDGRSAYDSSAPLVLDEAAAKALMAEAVTLDREL